MIYNIVTVADNNKYCFEWIRFMIIHALIQHTNPLCKLHRIVVL
jgi:hypothetical protein